MIIKLLAIALKQTWTFPPSILKWKEGFHESLIKNIYNFLGEVVAQEVKYWLQMEVLARMLSTGCWMVKYWLWQPDG